MCVSGPLRGCPDFADVWSLGTLESGLYEGAVQRASASGSVGIEPAPLTYDGMRATGFPTGLGIVLLNFISKILIIS